MKRIIAFVFAVLTLLSSCDKNEMNTTFPVSSDSGKTIFKPVICEEKTEGTKSILGDDVEVVNSGCQVIVFNRDTGTLEGVFPLNSGSGAPDFIELSSGNSYDFYVIGNLWFLDDDGNKRTWQDLFDRRGVSPSLSSDMTDASKMPYYRMDGKTVPGTGLRTEKFSECAEFGIPFSGMALNVTELDLDSEGRFNVNVNRMFAKEVVTIDHSGLDGNLDVSFFKNTSLYLRQVNCKLHPFISNVCASGPEDIMDGGDCVAAMENGSKASFVLYLPENAQGRTSGASSGKTVEDAPPGKSSLVTYVEFTGAVDRNAGGYGGNIRYQFCLGADSFSDFNVVRNTEYHVGLGFNAGSLFSPCWKVACIDDGGLDDRRIIGICADREGKRMLARADQMIALRKSDTEGRDCYVYFNKDNVEGCNQYVNHIDPYAYDYSPANVTRSAVKVETPDLSSIGARCDFDPVSGKISLVVTQPSKFVTGKEFTIKIFLYSTGNRKEAEYTAVIRTCDDMRVGADFSDFYVGMKRKIVAEGFCGENLSLKLLSGDAGILRTTNEGETGGYLSATALKLEGTSRTVYAYRNGNVRLSISSDDEFNDGEHIMDIRVRKPIPSYDRIPFCKIILQDGSILENYACELPIDGTPVGVLACYVDEDGNEIKVGTTDKDFDAKVYDRVLAFVYSSESQEKWFRYDETDGVYYINRLYDKEGAGRKLFGYLSDSELEAEKMYRVSLSDFLYIHPRDVEVFCEKSDKRRVDMVCTLPYLEKSFDDVRCNVMNRAEWPSITTDAVICPSGCSSLPYDEGNIGKNYRIVTGKETCGKVSLSCSGNRITYRWTLSGADVSGGMTYLTPPYGEREISLAYRNRWSGEYFSIPESGFRISHETVEMCIFPVYLKNSELARLFLCSALSSFLFIDSHAGETTFKDKPLCPFGIYSAEMECFRKEYDSPSTPSGEEMNINGYLELTAAYASYVKNGNSGNPSSYEGAVFDDSLISFSSEQHPGYPDRMKFIYRGTGYSDLPNEAYPGSGKERDELYKYVKLHINESPKILDKFVSAGSW